MWNCARHGKLISQIAVYVFGEKEIHVYSKDVSSAENARNNSDDGNEGVSNTLWVKGVEEHNIGMGV